MGSLNPLAKPKTPAPVVVAPPTIDDTANQDALTAERKRRQAATGSTGNIVSTLANATTDLQSSTKKSTLLGG